MKLRAQTKFNRRRFIYCAATGLMVPYARAGIPIPLGFFKPASSSSSVTPGSLSNLVVWFKADSFSLSDGTAIGGTGNEWQDQGPNDYDATQGTAGLRPLFKTNIFGSMPAIRFDGTDDILEFAGGGLSLLADFTIMIVTKNVDYSAEYRLLLGIGAGTSQQVLMGLSGNNTLSLYNGVIATSTAFSTSAADARLNVLGRDGTAAKYYENNGVDKSNGTLVAGLSGLQRIGGYGGGAQYFNGDMAEIVVYSDIKSQATVQSLYTNYFKPRWGLP